MKNLIEMIRQNYKLILGVLLFGLFLGIMFGRSMSGRRVSKSKDLPADTSIAEQTGKHAGHSVNVIWTCSMHPQIRMDHPGKCPICGMDLVPLQENGVTGSVVSPDEIQMTEAAMKIADIQTMVVQRSYPDKEIYLLGKVKPDERNIAELTARFGGRIEKLYVNFTGQHVSKGEKLATIYSPVLVTAQKELLEAFDYKQSNPDLYKAARNKLKLWDLTEAQVDAIEKSGQAQRYFDVLSPIEGTVTRRNVAIGDYIKEGTALFQVIDLKRVWVMFEAYESDLPWIKQGDKAGFTIQSLPGKNFNGRVSFIDPLIDPKTRIAQIRIEVENPGLILKPEMFANGIITSTIAGNRKDLLIPKTAILWTGKRAVVYVKVPEHEQPTFKYREIVLGPLAGEYYVVNKGLSEGEVIAVNGVFKIDAAAQLAGKPSMMNPVGGMASTGHNHGGMNVSSESGEVLHASVKTKGIEHKEESKAGEDKVQAKDRDSEISQEFREQLTRVYQAYLPVKNAFIASNPHEVAMYAGKLMNVLNSVNMKLLAGKSHVDWMDQLKVMKESLNQMEMNHDMQNQRVDFANFNTVFHKSIKQFGLTDVIIYYQYCPMAVDGKGAYWLSDTKEISNPYFGDEMPKCGETRETLKY